MSGLRWYVVTATDVETEITDRVRLRHGDDPGIAVGANAEEGSGASVTITIDDPLGDLHLLNHRRVYATCAAAPAGHQRVGNWFISDLDITRETWYTGSGRVWIVTMEDENSIIPRRIFVGGDSVRPAETDVARIQWLLTATEFSTVKDWLYFDTAGPVNLDAADFTGQKVDGLLSAAKDASGKNYFVWFNELAIAGTISTSSVANPTVITTTGNHNLVSGASVTISGHTGSTPAISGVYVVTVTGLTTFTIPVNVTVGGTGGTVVEPRYSLAYFNFNTYELYESALSLSNDSTEIDSTTVFAISDDTRLNRAGGRIASGMYLPYAGGYVYIQDTAVGDVYVRRDVSAPAVNVKSSAKATAQATRLLAELKQPDDLVTTSITVEEANVNAVMHGMRVQIHAVHLPNFTPSTSDPGYPDRYVWMRVMRRTVSQIGPTTFRIDLSLTPTTPGAIEQFYTFTTPGSCISSSWPDPPGSGNSLVSFMAGRDGGSGNDPNFSQSGVPDGTSSACPSITSLSTPYTFIRSISVDNGVGQTGVAAMAWRTSTVGEPQMDYWQVSGGSLAMGRPRVHYVETAGISGAPTVVASAATGSFGGDPGPTFTSPNIMATGAGYIYAGFIYRCTGPDDGSSPNISLAATAPAVDLTQGWSRENFGPFSWFGYLKVAGAGTYNIVLNRTNTPRASYGHGWIMGGWVS